jgi:tRNA threonylcarbamoyl adenosine modification protein YjeE
MNPIIVDLPDEAATRRLGADLALALKPGDCLALSGELGAGKSTLARSLIRAMADDADLEVPSPTFTLVQPYELRFPVAHFDLYRLSDPSELDELGLDECLSTGAALVEWPENAGERLPETAVRLRIEGSNGRRITIDGPAPAMERIGRTLRIRRFLDKAGLAEAERHYLLGDASPRAYEIIREENGNSAILMNAPQFPPGAIVRDGKPYTQLAHIAEDVRPFVAIDHWLRSNGFSAPEILDADLDDGLLLIEDFGREGMLDASGNPIAERYGATIDVLAALHRRPAPRTIDLDDGTAHSIPPFDATAMGIEVEQLLAWYVPWKLGGELSAAMADEFSAIWAQLIARAQASEQHLLLRDVHSPNLFWLPERKGIARIGLIDFQDAMIGPTAYDVASLVEDARVTVGEELQEQLVTRYVAARSFDTGFDARGFRESLAIMGTQRLTKILGIFVRLKVRDDKAGYLRHLPRLETYLARALRHPVLHPLRDWYERSGILARESHR